MVHMLRSPTATLDYEKEPGGALGVDLQNGVLFEQVVVADVAESSLAAVQLHPGDVVLYVNGAQPEDAKAAVQRIRDSDTVQLIVQPGRQTAKQLGKCCPSGLVADCTPVAAAPSVRSALFVACACALLFVLPALFTAVTFYRRSFHDTQQLQSTTVALKHERETSANLKRWHQALAAEGSTRSQKLAAALSRIQAMERANVTLLRDHTHLRDELAHTRGQLEAAQERAREVQQQEKLTEAQLESTRTSLAQEQGDLELATQAVHRRNRTMAHHLQRDAQVKQTLHGLVALEEQFRSAMGSALAQLQEAEQAATAPSPPPTRGTAKGSHREQGSRMAGNHAAAGRAGSH